MIISRLVIPPPDGAYELLQSLQRTLDGWDLEVIPVDSTVRLVCTPPEDTGQVSMSGAIMQDIDQLYTWRDLITSLTWIHVTRRREANERVYGPDPQG
jgi:hypothetical protein